MLPVVQGQLGLVDAIKRLTVLGHIVSVPLVDNQDYDLVVDVAGKLNKVQVKSSARYNSAGTLEVQIKKVRANKTSNVIHNFDNTLVDYMYVYEIKGRAWFIPSDKIVTKTTLSMNEQWNTYLVD